MTDENRPLDRVGRAHEADYFRAHNRELIDALRVRLERRDRATSLAEATHIHDDDLLDRVAGQGIDADSMAVIHLVPLLQVAWADGEIQPDEKDLILEAAALYGIKAGPARERLDAMLVAPPSAAFVDAALDFIKALLAALPAVEAEQACENMATLALHVAEANGGLFGLIGKIEDSEKKALHALAQKLNDQYPHAAQRLLKRI